MSINSRRLTAFVSVLVILLFVSSSLGAWAQIKYKTLRTFKQGTGGHTPGGGLVFDHAGNLYGVTASGGTYKFGVVFELKPAVSGRWNEVVLHNFSGGNDGY